MKKLLSFILSAALLIPTTALADEAETKAITVAINAMYAPFEYYENGELTGFDIDVMNYIALKNGYEVNYIDIPFDSLIHAINSGRADCAISTITYTPERDESVDFSTPYLIANVTSANDTHTEKYSIVFRSGLSDAVHSGPVTTDDEKLFRAFEVTIGNMIHDGIIDELIEKYNLDTALDTEEYDYEYSTATTYVMDTDRIIHDKIFTPSDWAKDSITVAAELGITDSDEQYLYPRAITREQFCELIYNYITKVIGVQIGDFSENFSDTDNEKIAALYSMGIVNGKSDTDFEPIETLTREEAAVILNRMINVTAPVPVTEMYFEFEDSSFISDWADEAVQVMCNMGVMSGVGNNTFAPLERYTTEQAIATLVRVYEAQKPNLIPPTPVPTEFVVTDTISVDEFYINEAIKLAQESGELAGDKAFISYYTANDKITEQISAIGSIDFANPTEIYYLSADTEQILKNITALLDEEAENFDIDKLLSLNKVNFSSLAAQINASYGTNNLAALTILINNEGYIMPEDFTEDFALLLKYDGDYSAIVSFFEYGKDVISANMSFVRNGDRDNVFLRINEITAGLGENSIKTAIVK